MTRLGSKQPYEAYYVSFNFANLIGSSSIATAAVIVTDSSGATCTTAITTVANQTMATSTVNIWIKGGVSGSEYQLSCKITTNAAPQERYELDAILPVEEL